MNKPLPTKKSMPIFYIGFLVTIINICDVLIYKSVTIFGFTIAMSGLLFPFSFLLLSSLSENYGHKETEKAILMILLAQAIFMATISIAIRLPSVNGIPVSNQYFALYKNLWKLIIVADLALFLSFYASSFLNSKIKIWLLGKHIILRYLIVNSIAKAILVFISYPASFYGIMSMKNILIMSFNTWVFKIFASLVLAIFFPYLIKLNKKMDKVDIYDFNTVYNPIKMFDTKNSGENMYGKKLY